MYSIEYLLKNSNLPGPRGNLELLYAFSKQANNEIIKKCLEYIKTDTTNSPEEFVGMCGITGYAYLYKKQIKNTLAFIRKYASHNSWRIREAVAIGIQEISEDKPEETIENIHSWIGGDFYEQRAVVAGFCEPKLLKNETIVKKILVIMEVITHHLNHDRKLNKQEESLRKALGYGWSVIIVASGISGRKQFENLFCLPGKHIRWIIKENLKKNRLIKMDPAWVEKYALLLKTKPGELN